MARFILAAAVFGWLAFPPLARAQGVVVTVSTSPTGVQFQVDGQSFSSTQSFAWPIGSQHTLSVASIVQPNPVAPTVYTFQSWADSLETYTSPQITVIANAAVTQYLATFSATYTLTVSISSTCGTIPCSGAPGTILLDGSPLLNYGPAPYAAGSVQILTAVPNPGYVFASWTPGRNQRVTGVDDAVTMNAPETAVANFLLAAPVTFDTSPEEFRLLVDTMPVTAPYSESLGWGTVHNVSAISPQSDNTSHLWVFSSWSDGGTATHTYTAPAALTPATLTATFVPAAVSTFLTSPTGLGLTVDGRSNWVVWNFAWPVGSTHTFSAAPTQTDSAGHLWSFTGWSNGGPASQTVTVSSMASTYAATYQQLGQLTINSSLPSVSVAVNGTPCPTPCTVTPPLGTPLTISAPASVPAGPNSREDFLGWSTGAGPGNLTITAPANATTVTANYHLMNQLRTAVSPAGAGTWHVQPGSPDGFYDSSTVVNLNVSAAPGYQFSNLSGDLTGIAPFGTAPMNQPRSVTALFRTVPFLPPGAVTNGAAATLTSAVAPGSSISIFGANLADQEQENTASPMPQTLAGVTVSVGGRLLPLYLVSPGQINAQLPAELPVGPSTLTVTTPEQVQLTTGFTIAQDAPGLFSLTSNGKVYAIALHQDGSLVTEASPATAGETLTLFGTGFGPTTPMRPDGIAVPSSPSYVVTDPVSVQVGTASFAAQSAYALPGAVGIDIVQFALGSGASGGDFQLTVTVNKAVSNTVLLPVH
ncbi:MAG: hypothetical protein WBL61_23910 [Bryobacteraceae bacterium]